LDRIKQVKEVEATTKGDLSWVTSPPGSWNGNVELESPIVHGNIHGCNRRFIPKKKDSGRNPDTPPGVVDS
jgi:hypothetical protein